VAQSGNRSRVAQCFRPARLAVPLSAESPPVSQISPAQWARVTALFERLRERDRSDWPALLDREVPDDTLVRAEVMTLLAADADDGFLSAGSAVMPADAAAPPSLIGRLVGPYRVEHEIGRGGMGIVYAARHADPLLDKHVAIKTLFLGVDRPEVAARFRRERRILATLEHPNIAALYDGGTTKEGMPYLAMEYVSGKRIDAWCDEHTTTIAQRLDLFRQVCAAVQFAHSRLIVHRDLKPGNILVSDAGVVKLLDFGIAKMIADDSADSSELTELTRGGAPLTAAYASPEQVRGGVVGTSSDVYSLGVILHRLLTGTLPFAGTLSTSSLPSTRTLRSPSDNVTASHPSQCGLRSTSELRSALRGELDAIVLMALRDEPERRYSSVEALSGDVLRYLKGLPVHARPDTVRYRAWMYTRRHWPLVTAGALALLAVAVGTIVSLRAARSAQREAERTARVARVLQEALGAAGSDRYAAAPSQRTILDSARALIAREFPDDPRSRADLYRGLGPSYLGLGSADVALLLLDSARVLHASTIGMPSLDVAVDLRLSTTALYALGQTDSAIARDRAAVAMLRQMRPLPAQMLSQSEIELSFKEINLFNLSSDAALQRMRSALDRERTHAAPSWGTIALGEAVTITPLVTNGRLAAADSAIGRADFALARTPPAAQAARSTLAFLAQGMLLRGRAAEAEPRIRALHSATVERFGAGHYLASQSQGLLARALLAQAKHAEGLLHIDSAIAINRALPATDPYYFAAMYLTRAGFDIAMRRWARAEEHLRLAATQRDRLTTQRAIIDVSLHYTRAMLAEAQGDLPRAGALYREAVALARTELAPGAGHAGIALQKLAAFEAQHGAVPLERPIGRRDP
jgi:serine/threonine protein kinase